MLRAVVYQLGVDLGTTFTAAAVHRTSTSAEVVALSPRSASVASVLYLGEDSGVLVGEAAERRAVTDPERVIREFKRRIGDLTPLMVAGSPQHAHELTGFLARWVVDRVTEREGAAPDRIAITHPAGWGPHKMALLTEGLRAAGLDDVVFLTEPEAAAVHYASAQRIEPGGTIAVYDLGGGTFDAAVLRRTECAGFELLGRPEGIERLGGIDFDEVVFDHVRASITDVVDELDPEDPVTVAAVARLRRDCTEAKEALSTDTEVTIPVLLPGTRAQIRLVRGEFEAMIRPALDDTVEALRRTVRSAGLEPEDLAAVLLVGGSSRIPLVAQLISMELGRPVAVDTDQSTSVATGAALAAFDARPVLTRTDPPTRPVVTTAPLSAPRQRGRKRPKIIVGATGIMAIGVAALAAVTWADRSTGTTTTGEPNQTATVPNAPAELNVRATVPQNPATSPSRTSSSAPTTTPASASKPTTTTATTTAMPRIEPPTPVVEPPVTTTFSPPPPSVTSSIETPPPPDPPSTRPPAP
ncbi:Hsp70 protein [Lentzea atacamensis]|uniref:Hsp70 protein n=1 Tax=Lentzea atacamensis TaxID=531938 RepID=A0A316I9L8_9PSEU|nr:Hsp70 protein [Lentzea atacamensis]